jgi:hypothetical protein
MKDLRHLGSGSGSSPLVTAERENLTSSISVRLTVWMTLPSIWFRSSIADMEDLDRLWRSPRPQAMRLISFVL